MSQKHQKFCNPSLLYTVYSQFIPSALPGVSYHSSQCQPIQSSPSQSNTTSPPSPLPQLSTQRPPRSARHLYLHLHAPKPTATRSTHKVLKHRLSTPNKYTSSPRSTSEEGSQAALAYLPKIGKVLSRSTCENL